MSAHPVPARTEREPVVFQLDGEAVTAHAGDTIASALVALGRVAWRRGPDGAPRGLYCGIGVCFDCLVDVDGRSGERACLVPVRDGMVVRGVRP